MQLKKRSCCFSGHRPSKLPWGNNESDPRCIELKAEIASKLEEIYALGYTNFICGMALGCDLYFAEAVLALRDIHPEISIEAAIPCRTQPDRWANSNRIRYYENVNSCNKVTVLQGEYTDDCMMQRNRYMVDKASLLLACYDGRSGGTMSTILYAKRSGLEVMIIDLY